MSSSSGCKVKIRCWDQTPKTEKDRVGSLNTFAMTSTEFPHWITFLVGFSKGIKRVFSKKISEKTWGASEVIFCWCVLLQIDSSCLHFLLCIFGLSIWAVTKTLVIWCISKGWNLTPIANHYFMECHVRVLFPLFMCLFGPYFTPTATHSGRFFQKSSLAPNASSENVGKVHSEAQRKKSVASCCRQGSLNAIRFGWIKHCKCIDVLRDVPYNSSASFGLVIEYPLFRVVWFQLFVGVLALNKLGKWSCLIHMGWY